MAHRIPVDFLIIVMNPEDSLNPAQPNIRDDAVEKMMRLVFLWFYSFALAVLIVIAMLLAGCREKPKVIEEYAIQKLDPPVDWSQHTNVYYATTVEANRRISFSVATIHDEIWLWTTVPGDNNWHWTNVVFSSTREPVVTKTNGEWRIGFK